MIHSLQVCDVSESAQDLQVVQNALGLHGHGDLRRDLLTPVLQLADEGLDPLHLGQGRFQAEVGRFYFWATVYTTIVAS